MAYKNGEWEICPFPLIFTSILDQYFPKNQLFLSIHNTPLNLHEFSLNFPRYFCISGKCLKNQLLKRVKVSRIDEVFMTRKDGNEGHFFPEIPNPQKKYHRTVILALNTFLHD